MSTSEYWVTFCLLPFSARFASFEIGSIEPIQRFTWVQLVDMLALPSINLNEQTDHHHHDHDHYLPFDHAQWSDHPCSISAANWAKTGCCHNSCNDPVSNPVHVARILVPRPKKKTCFESKKRQTWYQSLWSSAKSAVVFVQCLTWNKCEWRKSQTAAVQIKMIPVQKVQTKVLATRWRNARRREAGYLI